MSERLKYPLIITLICLVAAGALAVTFALTKDRIAASKQGELEAALKAVLPAEARSVGVTSLGDGRKLYTAYEKPDEQGAALGYAAIGAAQGYSSKVKVLVGVDRKMTIREVRILDQQETPGLGERTREVPATQSIWGALAGLFGGDLEAEGERVPQFQKQFRGRTEGDLVLVKEPGSKDNISQLTGATITSRAVVTAVKQAIEVIKANAADRSDGADSSPAPGEG